MTTRAAASSPARGTRDAAHAAPGRTTRNSPANNQRVNRILASYWRGTKNWRGWVADAVAVERQLSVDLIGEPTQSPGMVKQKKRSIQAARDVLSHLAQLARLLAEFERVYRAEGRRGAHPDEAPPQLIATVAHRLKMSSQAVYKWCKSMGLRAASFTRVLSRNQSAVKRLPVLAMQSPRFRAALASVAEQSERPVTKSAAKRI